MANKAIMIEVDDEAEVYRLVGPDGEEGAITDYGVPATLKIGNETYLAFIGGDGLADSDLGPDAFLVTAVETDVEDVSFELADEADATTVETETEETDEGDEDDSADGTDAGETAADQE